MPYLGEASGDEFWQISSAVFHQAERMTSPGVAHYNDGRPHRTLDLETPTGPPPRASPPRTGRIVARPVRGRLHDEYAWLAA